jgi:hypothetical protein
MYLDIYNKLCESNKSRKSEYKQYSNLHRHHIKPTHSGGTDDDFNFTYLTIREHIIAHFLLWKIYNNPNDIRAMKMLGAKISSSKRKIMGEFCRDNKIGIFSEENSQNLKIWRIQNAKKAFKTSYKNKTGIHNPTTKSQYCSLGGKIGGKSQHKNKTGIHNPNTKSEYCSLGGKSHIGKLWIYKGTTNTRTTQENLQKYLNDGWKLGMYQKRSNK